MPGPHDEKRQHIPPGLKPRGIFYCHYFSIPPHRLVCTLENEDYLYYHTFLHCSFFRSINAVYKLSVHSKPRLYNVCPYFFIGTDDEQQRPPITVVCYVGGITHAEIAALRFLSRRQGRRSWYHSFELQLYINRMDKNRCFSKKIYYIYNQFAHSPLNVSKLYMSAHIKRVVCTLSSMYWNFYYFCPFKDNIYLSLLCSPVFRGSVILDFLILDPLNAINSVSCQWYSSLAQNFLLKVVRFV